VDLYNPVFSAGPYDSAHTADLCLKEENELSATAWAENHEWRADFLNGEASITHIEFLGRVDCCLYQSDGL
jgi:hypothetical protein